MCLGGGGTNEQTNKQTNPETGLMIIEKAKSFKDEMK
jgi:hypothetical protein